MIKPSTQERVLSALLSKSGVQKAGANKRLSCRSLTKEMKKLQSNYDLRIQTKFVNNKGGLSECYVITDRITARRAMRKMRSKRVY